MADSNDFTPKEIMRDAVAGLRAIGFKPTGLDESDLMESWQEFGYDSGNDIIAAVRSGRMTSEDFFRYLHMAHDAGYLAGYVNGRAAED